MRKLTSRSFRKCCSFRVLKVLNMWQINSAPIFRHLAPGIREGSQKNRNYLGLFPKRHVANFVANFLLIPFFYQVLGITSYIYLYVNNIDTFNINKLHISIIKHYIYIYNLLYTSIPHPTQIQSHPPNYMYLRRMGTRARWVKK